MAGVDSTQCAAVRTVLAFNKTPPHQWRPLSKVLTMKGNSPAAAGDPPTMNTAFDAGRAAAKGAAQRGR